MHKKGLLMVTLIAAMALAQAQSTRSRVLLHNGAAQIDVIVEGDGDAIVLLPSSQRGSEDFDDVAQRIAAAGHRVLRPQPRGIGASNGALHDLTLHALASDVAVTIRELGGGRAIVVGHAYGHYVARVTDLDYRHRPVRAPIRRYRSHWILRPMRGGRRRSGCIICNARSLLQAAMRGRGSMAGIPNWRRHTAARPRCRSGARGGRCRMHRYWICRQPTIRGGRLPAAARCGMRWARRRAWW